jgi:hypothetical protein
VLSWLPRGRFLGRFLRHQAVRTKTILNRLLGISEGAAAAASWPLVWPDEWAISSGGSIMRASSATICQGRRHKLAVGSAARSGDRRKNRRQDRGRSHRNRLTRIGPSSREQTCDVDWGEGCSVRSECDQVATPAPPGVPPSDS